jgi:hypothetical protein
MLPWLELAEDEIDRPATISPGLKTPPPVALVRGPVKADDPLETCAATPVRDLRR